MFYLLYKGSWSAFLENRFTVKILPLKRKTSYYSWTKLQCMLHWVWVNSSKTKKASTTINSFFSQQVVGTMLLAGTVCALTDKRNSPPNSGVLPLIVGLIVFVIGISFGINCGYGINPARDLIPRVFTAIAGWGSEPFTWVITMYLGWSPHSF